MATYIRGAGAHVAERVAPEPGSDDETRYEQLAADPQSGWRRIQDVEEPEPVEEELPPPPPAAPAPLPPADLPVEPGKRPPQSAPKADWAAWAVAHGMDAEQADDLTKAELIELADQLAKE